MDNKTKKVNRRLSVTEKTLKRVMSLKYKLGFKYGNDVIEKLLNDLEKKRKKD